jgi:N utilization substance protein B
MNTSVSSKTPFKKRSSGRLAAVQALFQIEQSGSTPSSVALEFLTHRVKDGDSGIATFDTSFFTKLVEGAWSGHETSDEMIKGTLKTGWTLERIEPVTRAILRAALYEFLATQTPSAVIIDEYLNITRAFFNDTEVSFVNGVLNTLSQKIRVSG